MNWYKIAKNEFTYSHLERDFWHDLIGKAQEKFNIHFDLENDSSVGEIRKIKLDNIKYINEKPYYILAQLYSAGGDWQNHIAYFRCQLKAGSGDWKAHFVFIPSKQQGNVNISNHKGSSGAWIASNHDDQDSVDFNEKELWKALKEYAEQYAAKECPSCPKIKTANLQESMKMPEYRNKAVFRLLESLGFDKNGKPKVFPDPRKNMTKEEIEKYDKGLRQWDEDEHEHGSA